jgi:hypothetical protein
MRSITVTITTALLTASLISVPLVSRLLADEPPAQGAPSTGTANEAGTATGAQERASIGTAPQLPDESTMPTPEPEGSGPPSDAGEVQERGFGPARLPQSSLPGTALINAGTLSLTTVANQIRVTHKSVSIHVDVPGGLSLPIPVEVTAKFVVHGFSSPELKGITGLGGVHLVHHMPDKPMIPGGGSAPTAHPVMVYLTLRETNQTARSFSLPVRKVTITPLYGINLFNMKFQLVKGCDSWIRGKSDITLNWTTPSRTQGRKFFKLNGGEALPVPEFDWFALEAQQANLFEPVFLFREQDKILHDFDTLQATQLLRVVPGRHRAEAEQNDAGGAGCTARIAYTIHRKLLTF